MNSPFKMNSAFGIHVANDNSDKISILKLLFERVEVILPDGTILKLDLTQTKSPDENYSQFNLKLYDDLEYDSITTTDSTVEIDPVGFIKFTFPEPVSFNELYDELTLTAFKYKQDSIIRFGACYIDYFIYFGDDNKDGSNIVVSDLTMMRMITLKMELIQQNRLSPEAKFMFYYGEHY